MKPAKELAQAAGQGDLATMERLLAADPAIAGDWQPIMDACFLGQVPAVTLLLDRGADPNVLSKTNYRYRPLHRTIERKISVPRTEKHGEVVELLLGRGADPLLPGAWCGVNAIVFNTIYGDLRFLPLLLARVSDYDLFTAAALGDAARVQALIGADPSRASAKTDNGWTALRYCCESRIGESDPAKAGELAALARWLMEGGADATGCLDPVVYRNNASLAALLVEKGVELTDGDTLNHAACDGMHASLDVLAQSGVDLNKTEGTEHHGGYVPYGCTLTMRSVRGATWFLDQGVDPNYVGGGKGESSLHVAVRSGAGVPLLKLLVERGADPNARDGGGVTPLAAAHEKAHKNAVEYLSSIGAEQ